MDAVLLWTASKMPQSGRTGNWKELNGGGPSLNRPFSAVNGYTPSKGYESILGPGTCEKQIPRFGWNDQSFALSRNSRFCMKPGLEYAAQLEEPFLVAGVADAAAKQDGSEESFREHAAGEITGKSWSGEGVAVHFADFGKTGEIDLLADEILIADQFVQAVGAETSDAAEKIDGRVER